MKTLRLLFAPDGGLDPPGANYGDELPVETVYVTSEEEIPKPETPPEEEPNAIRAQNQELQAKLAQLEEEANIARRLESGIEGLGKTMRPAPQQPAPVQQQGESDEAFRKRLNEHLYDDPASMLDEYQDRKMRPLLAQFITNNLATSRKMLQLDPEKKENYMTYKDEIEAEVARIPPYEKLQNPDIYEQAYERVLARNINTIIEQRVQKAIKEQLESQQQAPKKPAPDQHHVEQTTYRKPEPKKEYRVLTKQEKQQAQQAGVDYDTYWNYLKGQGLK